MRRALSAALVGLLAAAVPASGQWPAGAGNFWGKVSFFHHQTTEQFRADGEKKPFINTGAESISQAIFLDLNVGVTDRLDLWLQAPYYDLEFNDAAGDRKSTGIGDVRLSARYNLFQLREGSLPVSARFTTKFPVNEFPIDAEIVPVGEGQFDFEAWLEGGLSLWPLPAYSVVWVGYRWRLENSKTTRKPGNELVFLAELGGTELVGGLGGKVVLDGIFGEPGAIQGVQLGSVDEREILYLAPTLFYSLTPSTLLEVGVRIPLQGKNYPAGAPMQIGLFRRGSFWN
ncbi:MAG: hypothetical protein AMS19_13950 [Gemmatimonas sp. SG8_23]|nr:MAG: hypothetical protein AMS19_13950 [Gemmatimonas sp. SG8_23]